MPGRSWPAAHHFCGYWLVGDGRRGSRGQEGEIRQARRSSADRFGTSRRAVPPTLTDGSKGIAAAVDGYAAPEQNVADCSLPIIPQHALSANAACNCWQIGSADVSGTLVKGNSSAFWPRTLRQWAESACSA